MTSSLSDKIIKDTYTKQEALARLSELRIATQEHFFGKAVLSKEENDLLGGIDKESSDKFFSQAEKELEEMEAIVIYVALEPSDILISEIGKKARTLFGEGTLLEFKTDRSLIGGAALAWKGQYKDYSLRARFEEKKEEIQKIYKKYLQIS